MFYSIIMLSSMIKIYFGDYPASMRERVGARLPTFTPEQTERIKGSHDFFGLNHYTSRYCSNQEHEDIPEDQKDYYYDMGTKLDTTDVDGNLIGKNIKCAITYNEFMALHI